MKHSANCSERAARPGTTSLGSKIKGACHMSIRLRTALIIPVVALLVFFASAENSINGQRRQPPAPDESLKVLQWRMIGPYRGGRVTAVAGVASQPQVYYFGATGGGVFKTSDGGFTWIPITDGQVTTGSVGAIGVAESDPNVLYLGMGESPVRGNVSHGDGVYKSTDA